MDDRVRKPIRLARLIRAVAAAEKCGDALRALRRAEDVLPIGHAARPIARDEVSPGEDVESRPRSQLARELREAFLAVDASFRRPDVEKAGARAWIFGGVIVALPEKQPLAFRHVRSRLDRL